MKKLIFILFLVHSFFLFAQKKIKVQNLCGANNCPASDNIIFSTGINPSTGEVLPSGSIDPAWQLLNYPPLNGTTTYPVNIPDAHVISPHQGSSTWNAVDGAGILSSINISPFGTNTFHGQPWRFRRNFCVCSDSRFKISGKMRADDLGSINIYNSEGELLFSKATGDEAYGNDVFFSTNLNLSIGSYYIEFHLNNNHRGGMGFAIQGNIMNLSNQATLLNGSDFCCANTGFITVQKILETKKCNGQFDPSDETGEGWTFYLQNASGEVIQTQTTNEFGEAVFNGLPEGNYVVTEVEQSGWYANEPDNGSQHVTLSVNSGVNLTFFNCKGNRPTCCPGKNLVPNGDFELGNIGFTSEFNPTTSVSLSSILPGSYGVINENTAAIISPSWTPITDPTTCSNTGRFLVVNGENGSPFPSKKVIWEQDVSIKKWTKYKFCFKAKNLDQLGFDNIPKLDVVFSNPAIGNVLEEEINVWESPCLWKDIEKNFNIHGDGSIDIKIQIILNQAFLGDGNDVAIDNIALIELPPSDISFTDFSVEMPSLIEDNKYSINVEGLLLPKECACAWTVCELDPETDQCKEETRVYNDSDWWSISTYCTSFNFAGYKGNQEILNTEISEPGEFNRAKIYRITRGAYCECKAWKQTSYDLFEKNNRLVIRDTKSRKIIKRFPLRKKKSKNHK